jgi:hypothetical protein
MVARPVASRVGAATPARPSTGPVGVAGELVTAYTLGWTVLLAVAAVCATVPAARWLAHHELALALHVRIRPAPRPTLAGAGWLLVNNLRATGWPLLAAGLRAQHPAWLRRAIGAGVLVSVTANLLPVAAAVGVYRAAIVPYLPHLPLELYAITTGPTAWLLATRRPIPRRQLLKVALTLVVTLAAAAALETWAVPHQ